MNFIKIKPLSVNKCWQGRRFKTKDYLNYEILVSHNLPKSLEIPQGDLRLTVEVGMSNSLSDLDNMIKPFQDILQKKYGFNDKAIHELIMRKEKVKKGDEFISFQIESLNQ
jgi:Holliday junction resolvase RusA-like endonuclease